MLFSVFLSVCLYECTTNKLFTNAKCYLFHASTEPSLYFYINQDLIYCVCLVFCYTIQLFYVLDTHTAQQELNLCKQVNCLSDFTLEYLKHF